jgi:hypothetical protein
MQQTDWHQRVTGRLTSPMGRPLFEANLMCMQSHPCKIALTPFYRRHESRAVLLARLDMWDKKRIQVGRPCLRGAICQGGNLIGRPLDVCKTQCWRELSTA